MARIRSIKPEFWSDEKVFRLSYPCALFFISCWNFADDEGKFKNNPKQLQLNAPIFRTQDIQLYLKKLAEVGLLVGSRGAEWWLVVGWEHQRIDRPRAAKIKACDIEWVNASGSPIDRRPLDDHSTQGEERIGKEGYNPIIPFVGEKNFEESGKGKESLTDSLLSSQLSQLVSVWGETLSHFGIQKDPRLDQPAILRSLKNPGRGFDGTRAALIGARFEPPTNTFVPSENLTVERTLGGKMFPKLCNLGFKKRAGSDNEGRDE